MKDLKTTKINTEVEECRSSSHKALCAALDRAETNIETARQSLNDYDDRAKVDGYLAQAKKELSSVWEAIRDGLPRT